MAKRFRLSFYHFSFLNLAPRSEKIPLESFKKFGARMDFLSVDD